MYFQNSVSLNLKTLPANVYAGSLAGKVRSRPASLLVPSVTIKLIDIMDIINPFCAANLPLVMFSSRLELREAMRVTIGLHRDMSGMLTVRWGARTLRAEGSHP
jgi:hypothetical protein